MRLGVSRIIAGTAGRFGAFEWEGRNDSRWCFNTYDREGARLSSTEIGRFDAFFYCASSSLDRFAVSDGSIVRIFETGAGREISSCRTKGIEFMAFDPDGTLLVQRGSGRITYTGTHWHSDKVRPIVSANAEFTFFLEQKFGNMFLQSRGVTVRKLPNTGFAVVATAWSPDALIISEAGDEGKVRWLRLPDGELLLSLPHKAHRQVNDVAFAADDRAVLYEGDLETGNRSKLITMNGSALVNEAALDAFPTVTAFVANGTRFVTGERRIYDVASGRAIGTF